MDVLWRPPFWLDFGLISVLGGPRGGPEDPLFQGLVLESPFYNFRLHSGSILPPILGQFWSYFCYFLRSDFSQIFMAFGPILGSILASLSVQIEVNNLCDFLLTF